jgi:hypothetical protein
MSPQLCKSRRCQPTTFSWTPFCVNRSIKHKIECINRFLFYFGLNVLSFCDNLHRNPVVTQNIIWCKVRLNHEGEGTNTVCFFSSWEPELPTLILSSVMDICCPLVTNWISVQSSKMCLSFLMLTSVTPLTLETCDLPCVQGLLMSSCFDLCPFRNDFVRRPTFDICLCVPTDTQEMSSVCQNEPHKTGSLWPFQLPVDDVVQVWSYLVLWILNGMSSAHVCVPRRLEKSWGRVSTSNA